MSHGILLEIVVVVVVVVVAAAVMRKRIIDSCILGICQASMGEAKGLRCQLWERELSVQVMCEAIIFVSVW